MSLGEDKNLGQHMSEMAKKREALREADARADSAVGITTEAAKAQSKPQDLASMVKTALTPISMEDFLNFANMEAGVLNHEHEEKGTIYFNDEDLEDKTYIVRIEVRDNNTGEKSEKGKIKFSKSEGVIKMDADAGITEAETSVEIAHGMFFTHMIQATKEFIEDELDGGN
jgi:hypothetical protein